jgi:multiple sugar transport system permease protein
VRVASRMPTIRRRLPGLTDRWLALVMVAPTAVLIAAFGLYPIASAIYDSFLHIDPFTDVQTWVGLKNYVTVLTDPIVHGSILRSVIYTVANTAIETVLGTAVALLLNAPLRGRNLARGLVLFPFMIPGIVVALVFRFLFNPLSGIVMYLLTSAHIIREPVDLLGSPATALWTVIVVHGWKFTPFMIIVLLGRLQVIPDELYEAAKIDGAGRLRMFWYVTLPWLMPTLLVAMLLRTILNAQDFDVPYLLAYGGPLQATTVIPIQIRSLAFDQHDLGLATALSVCLGVVLVVSSVLYLRAYARSEAEMG